MTILRRPVTKIWIRVLPAALALSMLIAGGCKTERGGAATETNVTPAPCDTNADCPKGIECVFLGGDAARGVCDVNEMHVSGGDGGTGHPSSATPAPCSGSTECPAGIACIFPNGAGTTGICDVNEMLVTPHSSATPAPCHSNADCPTSIQCILPSTKGGSGFCNVAEMQAP